MEPTLEQQKATLVEWLKHYGLSDKAISSLVEKTYPEK